MRDEIVNAELVDAEIVDAEVVAADSQPIPVAQVSDGVVGWYQKENLVWGWMVAFFPVGLFGLWRNQSGFSIGIKIGTTVLVVFLFLFLPAMLRDALIVLVAAPLVAWRIWKDRTLAQLTKFAFAGVFGLYLLVFLGSAATPSSDGNNTYINSSANGSVVGDENRVFVTGSDGSTFSY